jgi:hypothetical protein
LLVFGRRCPRAGIELSMGASGYDNAGCQACFTMLKAALVGRCWLTKAEAGTGGFRFIECFR